MDDIEELFSREQDRKKVQALLGIATSDYIGTIDNEGYSASSPTPCEDWHTYRVWIAAIFSIVHTVVRACHLYIVTGKNEEATILLERLASNVKREIPETYKRGADYIYVLVSLALCFAAGNQDEQAVDLSIEPFNMPTSANTIDIDGTFSEYSGLDEDHRCEKAEALSDADCRIIIADRNQTYDKLHEFLLDELLQQASYVPFEVRSGAASLSTLLQQKRDAVQSKRGSHPQPEEF